MCPKRNKHSFFLSARFYHILFCVAAKLSSHVYIVVLDSYTLRVWLTWNTIYYSYNVVFYTYLCSRHQAFKEKSFPFGLICEFRGRLFATDAKNGIVAIMKKNQDTVLNFFGLFISVLFCRTTCGSTANIPFATREHKTHVQRCKDAQLYQRVMGRQARHEKYICLVL